MSAVPSLAVTWTPRVLGLTIVLFFSAFAFDGARLEPRAAMAVLMNLLPAAMVALALAGAWRLPSVGAVAFAALALAYAWMMRDHPSWVAAISGPLALTSVLFAASALATRRQSASDASKTI